LEYGDLSTLSFHATKVYNTVEGGALICHDAQTKQKIDYLKNFGFAGETEVVMPGINSKMDEIRAAYGLLSLKHLDENIVKRSDIVHLYRELLNQIEGISFFDDGALVRHNYSYFPIFVEEDAYGMKRDELFEKLKTLGYCGRRYFYPLITHFAPYKDLPSASPGHLPVATRFASQVICLPLYPELEISHVQKIAQIIRNKR
jgi:dTDP-4-amino-4,6-dideoxygalactose transaminase